MRKINVVSTKLPKRQVEKEEGFKVFLFSDFIKLSPSRITTSIKPTKARFLFKKIMFSELFYERTSKEIVSCTNMSSFIFLEPSTQLLLGKLTILRPLFVLNI